MCLELMREMMRDVRICYFIKGYKERNVFLLLFFLHLEWI